MEDEFLAARPGFADAVVEARVGPGGETLRFTFDKPGLHREVGSRQIQRVFVVHFLAQKPGNVATRTRRWQERGKTGQPAQGSSVD